MWLVAIILGNGNIKHFSHCRSFTGQLRHNISKHNSSSPAPCLSVFLNLSHSWTTMGKLQWKGLYGYQGGGRWSHNYSFPLTSSSELGRWMDKDGDEDLNKGHLWANVNLVRARVEMTTKAGFPSTMNFSNSIQQLQLWTFLCKSGHLSISNLVGHVPLCFSTRTWYKPIN